MVVVGVMVHFGILPLLGLSDPGLWGLASRMRGNRGNVFLQIFKRGSVGRCGKRVNVLSMIDLLFWIYVLDIFGRVEVASLQFK